MRNLFLFELRSRWKAVLGWGIGLIAFGSLYISVYPQVATQMAGLADLQIYAVMGVSMGSFAAYIGSVVLLFIPLLLGVYAIVTGTKALAGEEDDGTLELLMSHPITRAEIVLAKAVAIGVVLAAILVLAGLGNAAVLAGVNASSDSGVAPMRLFRALVNGWPITWAFAMLSLFLGSFLPNRRVAAMVATVIFVASYFGRNVANMVDSLAAIKPFSLFSYYNTDATVFTKGADPADVLILVIVALVFLVLSVLSFSRRNVTVGAWPWTRNRASG